MLSRSTADAPASTASATCSGRSHSTSTMRPGHHRRASATASAMPSRPRWLSFTSTASDSPARWFQPPPARTAAFSRARRPGRGLAGVEHPGGGVGGGDGVDEPTRHGGHPRQVAEEIERGALGGEDRPHRARHLGHHRPRHEPLPVGHAASRRPRLGSTCAKASSAHSRPASDPVGARHDPGPARLGLGHEHGREVPERADVLGQRPRHRLAHGAAGRVGRARRRPRPADARRRVTVQRARVRGRHGPVHEPTAPLRSRLGEVPPGVGAPGLLAHVGRAAATRPTR